MSEQRIEETRTKHVTSMLHHQTAKRWRVRCVEQDEVKPRSINRIGGHKSISLEKTRQVDWHRAQEPSLHESNTSLGPGKK